MMGKGAKITTLERRKAPLMRKKSRVTKKTERICPEVPYLTTSVAIHVLDSVNTDTVITSLREDDQKTKPFHRPPRTLWRPANSYQAGLVPIRRHTPILHLPTTGNLRIHSPTHLRACVVGGGL